MEEMEVLKHFRKQKSERAQGQKSEGSQMPKSGRSPPMMVFAGTSEEAAAPEASIGLLGDTWYPSLVDGTRFPRGVTSLAQWGKTKVTMPKYKSEDWTFEDMPDRACPMVRSGDTFHGCRKGIALDVL